MITSISRYRVLASISHTIHLLYISMVFTLSVTAEKSFSQKSTGRTTLTPTSVGTSKIRGTIDGVSIEGIVQGPAIEVAHFQVACVSEYTERYIFTPPALPAESNGMVHLDKVLNGLITELRRSGKFYGHAFETILIALPKGTISARRPLLIGLGNRNTSNPDLRKDIGAISMWEALRLGVSHYALASDIKDAGMPHPPGLSLAMLLGVPYQSTILKST